MNYKSLKKWTIRTLIAIVVISIAIYIGIKLQLNQSSGANTEVVDRSIFKVTESPLAITNVSVLSPACTKMIDSLTVLVNNGEILNVAKDIKIPNGYKTIDGTGQYLIPGLVDTHAHLGNSKNDLLLYLANGITHISEMFGKEKHLKWRQEAHDGALSPRIFVATRKLGSEIGIMPQIRSWFGARYNYANPSGAKKAVIKFKQEGYDALKLSSFLEPKIYGAMIEEANRLDIPVICHLSTEVGLNTFYSSGQSQLAHIEEITKNTMETFGGLEYDNCPEYLEYLKKHCDSIAIQLKKHEIAVSSTIWLMESLPKQKFDLDNFIKTLEIEYANPGNLEGSRMAKGWLPGYNSYENLDIKNNSEKNQKSQIFWKTYIEAIHIMTKALVDNDVTILAGTDSNTACVVPGFSLHDELESLNNSGLTNSQVLFAATVAPGEWMQSNAGKIEIGRRADLVLLAQNPLKDIRNTRTINAVITDGKLLDKELLESMLLSVKKANNRSRKKSIAEFID